MAVNNNRPVQPNGGFDKNSIKDMNNVAAKAIEAVADKIYDADGDKTSFKDVGKAASHLSPSEKVAMAAGSLATAGALPMISLGVEKAADAFKEWSKEPEDGKVKEAAKKAAQTTDKAVDKAGQAVKKAAEQVKKKYENPPEKELVKDLKDLGQKVGDAVEEFADDLMDGRIARDVTKNAKRFWRDNFTEQSKLDKIKNKVSDAAEDAAHAAADALDDIADGRTARKIKHKLD